ncbi:MAG: hypothetical protein A2Z07_00845 [Armatimonadetes bacterium RBG_16_67_12]|nr:MAG: hypothetical protein A2Z07_00845 [Armatimonadetes bacterium RBG_16_67_12]
MESLLVEEQVERGKEILASLGTEVSINSDGAAKIRSDLRKAITLVSGRGGQKLYFCGWGRALSRKYTPPTGSA